MAGENLTGTELSAMQLGVAELQRDFSPANPQGFKVPQIGGNLFWGGIFAVICALLVAGGYVLYQDVHLNPEHAGIYVAAIGLSISHVVAFLWKSPVRG